MDRSEWLERLIVLYGVNGADRIAGHHHRLLPVLADLGPEHFTEDTLAIVRGKVRSLASAARLRAALQETVAARRTQSSLGAADPSLWLPYWERRKDEGFADGSAANVLQLIRARCPPVFEHLCAVDTLAASIAVQRGWVREPYTGPPTDEQFAHVRDRVIEATAYLRGVSPADPTLSAQDQINAIAEPAAPSPRYLTPQQLDLVNPLPNGGTRHADVQPTHAEAASHNPDATAGDADATAGADDRSPAPAAEPRA